MSATMTLGVSSGAEQQIGKSQSNPHPGDVYSLPVGYLRAFITLLVVAHHAVLAYYPNAPAPTDSFATGLRLWRAFPVVDTHSWSGFALFVGFNDTFFMSLMFFLSGLFVWKSLERKDAGTFLRGRVLRLGLPFAIAAAVLAPLAYYPAYLQTGGTPGLSVFWHQWFSQPDWPAGPAWFLWVLLAFDVVAAALYAMLPRWGDALAQFVSGADRRPLAFYGALAAISTAAYLPLALLLDPFRWSTFGPFTFQTSRVLHYFVYFLAGAAVGAWGVGRGLLSPEGRLAHRWGRWTTAAAVAFILAIATFLVAISAHGRPYLWGTLGGATFTLSCAATSLAFLAIFTRFVKVNRPLLDSLRDNAYGIYVL
ncbi:MAG TPA: acyltransferase, partial [Candidatus Acidoferrales bacterium]|nr:acyltransferase [Candidatus Acidoferrales bacterium]